MMTGMQVMPERYRELDALRGVAVLCMIAYHVLFDLQYFYGYDIPIYALGWRWFAWWTATVFLLVVGICFVISWERTVLSKRIIKSLKRGVIIFFGGMIVSGITWVIAPDAFVKFGILHLIGLSALGQPMFWKFGSWNIVIGLLVIFVGEMFATKSVDSAFLFPLGLRYPGMQSLDYYPIFPWFGVILLGMGLGEWLYQPTRQWALQPLGSIRYPLWLTWCGRHSLLLYFLHQPVILLLLTTLGLPA